MSVPATGQTRPGHPGQMPREGFLPDSGLSISGLVAEALGVSRQTINELLRERRGVTPEMALRLSRLLATSAQLWINAQLAVDLSSTAQARKTEIRRIQQLRA